MRLSEQLWQNSEAPSTADTGTMSMAQDVTETVKSVHEQPVPVTTHNSVQAVTQWKPVPRVGPSPISIPSGKFVASMEPEDLDTPPSQPMRG